MNEHDMIRAMLDDHVDGLLSAEDMRPVEDHLARCGECRAEVEDLERLRAAVAELPREITPPHDLWQGIRARIETPAAAAPRQVDVGRVIEVDFRRPGRGAPSTGRGWLAAAAIVLIAASSTVTAMLVRSAGPGSSGGPAPVATAEPAGGAPHTALVAFEPAEQEFIDTAGELKIALEVQREQLDPETVRVVEQNLRIIDMAIAEARDALEADPNNRNLTLMLADVHRKRIDLLRGAVQLSSL